LIGVRVLEEMVDAPESSVTVSVTVTLLASLYVCVAVCPVPVVPSPKFHA
jgi:hypothetical protein